MLVIKEQLARQWVRHRTEFNKTLLVIKEQQQKEQVDKTGEFNKTLLVIKEQHRIPPSVAYWNLIKLCL